LPLLLPFGLYGNGKVNSSRGGRQKRGDGKSNCLALHLGIGMRAGAVVIPNHSEL
jgi:hypothetical protein